MLPIPAIDIQSGKCVRLQKGDLSSTKIYFEKPIDAAAHWIKEGTRKLHLVDLDGAKSGKPENLEYVLEIKEKFPDVNLQLGGGVRDLETLDSIFESEKMIDFTLGNFIGTKADFSNTHFGLGNLSFLKSEFGDFKVLFKGSSYSEGNNTFQYVKFNNGNVNNKFDTNDTT